MAAIKRLHVGQLLYHVMYRINKKSQKKHKKVSVIEVLEIADDYSYIIASRSGGPPRMLTPVYLTRCNVKEPLG